MKILSAFRVVKDFEPFQVGEVFEVSRFFSITSLDTRVGIKIVKELFKAAVGEPSSFELAYADHLSSPHCSSWSTQPAQRINGVVYLGMDTYDCPTIDIRGPVLNIDPEWCREAREACEKNDRFTLMQMQMWKKRDDIVLFSSEPGTGCLFDPYTNWVFQLVCASSRVGFGNAYLAVEAHATVDRGYLVRKTNKELHKLYSGRLYGYVLKINVSGPNGTFVLYSGGSGYVVKHPGSAFIYKTTSAAEGAFAGGRDYRLRSYAGSGIAYLTLDRNQTVKPEVLTTKQWRDEIWGKQTGVNYFAEIAKA